MRSLVLTLVCALALTGCGKDAPEKVAPDGLPDVTLPGLAGGDAVDLGDLKGPVVVTLWASWCPPCKKELPLFQQFAQAYDGRVDVLGVRYIETLEDKSLELLRTSGVTFPNVRDDDGAFRAPALPRLLLVDEQGRVAYDEYVKIEKLAELEDLVERHLG